MRFLIIAALLAMSCETISEEELALCTKGSLAACQRADEACKEENAAACETTGIALLLPGSGFSDEPISPQERRAKAKLNLRKACSLGRSEACKIAKHF